MPQSKPAETTTANVTQKQVEPPKPPEAQKPAEPPTSSETQQSAETRQLGGTQKPSGLEQPGVKIDNDIRDILQYYHIDDSNTVIVDDGSVQRVIQVHPERPSPLDIQENENLLEQFQG
ncbi:unnamed protein product, partial [Rotaria sp. Silwood2]